MGVPYVLRADKRTDLWYCCLVKEASCAKGTQRVKLPGDQSPDKHIHFFPAQTSKRNYFS